MKLEKIVLKGKRIVLRPLRKSDTKDIVEYAHEKLMHKFVTDIPYPYRKKDAEWFIKETRKDLRKGKELQLGIELDGKIIGSLGLHHFDKKYGEIGYVLGRKYRRKGYTSEAAKLLLDYGFKKLKLQRIGASCDIRNKASASLLKKLGFKQEGIFRKHRLVDGKYYDELRFGMLRKEYKK